MVFVYDALITKQWYPSYYLALSFVFSLVCISSWQLINFIVYFVYFGYPIDSSMKTQILAIVLLLLTYYASKIFYRIQHNDNLFFNKSGFFSKNHQYNKI